MNHAHSVMKLLSNRYGKARVRVMKILREREKHTVREIDVTTLLEGDFGAAYTAGDNSKVVATDTIKNTINVLAKTHLSEQTELFAVAIAQHFLARYKQVETVSVEISAKNWQRLQVNEKPHPHAFAAGGDMKIWTHVVSSRTAQTIQSGVRDLVILKSTGSGWEGYPKDEYTTLPETNDRILATSCDATWTWSLAPANYETANEAIVTAMLDVFASKYSPSAQASVFAMGSAALASCDQISKVDLKMPNKHYLLVNLKPFGLENENEVFVPTDEPHGQIEGSVVRDG